MLLVLYVMQCIVLHALIVLLYVISLIPFDNQMTSFILILRH